MIAEMEDKHGNLDTNRQNIADIFATFYEELYQHRPFRDDKHSNDNQHNNSNNTPGDTTDHHDSTTIPPFTINELDAALH
eukprot:7984973-Karenia_brevis.AAC.1